ncbi:hypothetical protein OO25_10515 [Phaeobacter sp. S60]|nr:hypothetical protein OO25_10515 [Phaeobacter sp. S60]
MRRSLPNTGGQLASFRLCIQGKNGQAAIGGANLPFQAKGLDQMHDRLTCLFQIASSPAQKHPQNYKPRGFGEKSRKLESPVQNYAEISPKRPI